MNTALIKPQWGPVTIALMVVGFVVWWPLGLAVLAYILWGEMFGGSGEKAESVARHAKAWCREQKFAKNASRRPSSGNAAFDEYRAEQMRRLDEERRRLDEEVEAFQEYMRHLHMARDREEFDRFVRERNGGRGFGEHDRG